MSHFPDEDSEWPQVYTKIPPGLKQAVDEKAKQSGLGRNILVRIALERLLKQLGEAPISLGE